MSHGGHWLRDEKDPKEENGICPEKHLETGFETGLGINLGSTV
jgi:hypothetical protein